MWINVPVSSSRRGDVLTVLVSGEVDISTAPAVANAITDAVAASGVNAVLVDLSEVGFLDSSGVALLLRGRRGAEEHDVAYRVVGARGMVRQVLELTGVWAHLSGETGQRRPTPP